MLKADVLKESLKAQLLGLEDLLIYLEDRGALSAKDYLYCRTKLQEALKHLKQLEHKAESGSPHHATTT